MLFFKSLVSFAAVLPFAAAAGYENAAYYPSWKTFHGHQPADMMSGSLSHIMYAFAGISANGSVEPFDDFADYGLQIDSTDIVPRGDDAWGNVKQLFKLKKANRKLKVLLSIGGATEAARQGFLAGSNNAAARARFSRTAIQLMIDYGMDGIDLDWEFPEWLAQGENYYSLMKKIREDLDAYAASQGQNYRYWLTAAFPAGQQYYSKLPLSKMNQVIDYFHLMAYDFSGSWSTVSSHGSNVHVDSSNRASTPFSADPVIKYYVNQGVNPKKMSFGIPLYGRSFGNTDGPGKAFRGVGGNSQGREAGVYDFKDIPRPGARVYTVSSIGAMYTYDASKREFVTMDGGASVQAKANYVKRIGYGGSFFWESSGDKTGSSSLIRQTHQVYGSNALQTDQNQLSYPGSGFANIRNGLN